MKTNNEIIKEIESGNTDVISQQRKETTKSITTERMKDSVWIGALQTNYVLALEEIIKLRKENERLENQCYDNFAQEHAEHNNYDDIAKEEIYDNVKINGEGDE